MGCFISVEDEGGKKLDHLKIAVNRYVCSWSELAEGPHFREANLLSLTVWIFPRPLFPNPFPWLYR